MGRLKQVNSLPVTRHLRSRSIESNVFPLSLSLTYISGRKTMAHRSEDSLPFPLAPILDKRTNGCSIAVRAIPFSFSFSFPFRQEPAIEQRRPPIIATIILGEEGSVYAHRLTPSIAWNPSFLTRSRFAPTRRSRCNSKKYNAAVIKWNAGFVRNQ